MAQLPRGGETPSAAAMVEGLEVQRTVSEALLALPEPTRTILVLRYQHDLGPAAIATRVGLQEAAVRQRLHRGREEVRARLQQRFGADWRGSLAVLGFLGRDAVRPATAGAMVACAAVLAIATGTTFLIAATSGVDAQPAVSTVANVVASVAAEAPARPVDMAMPTQERGVVRELVASAQDPKPSPIERTFTIRGRLIAAESRAPLQGTLRRSSGDKTTTAGDGTFVVSLPGTLRGATVWIHCEGRCPRWFEADPKRALELGDIPMTLGYAVRGRLVDEAGEPIREARVEAPIDGKFPRGGTCGFVAMTEPNGAFAFRELVPAGAFALRLDEDGLELLDGNVQIEPRAEGNEFVLHAKRRRAIRGHAFTPDGRPCSGVEIQATVAQQPMPWPKVVGSGRSKADGSFELFESEPGHETVQITTMIHDTHDLLGEPMQLAWGSSGVRIAVRERIPVRLALVEADSRKPVEECRVVRTWIQGKATHSLPGDRGRHDGGKVTFDGVANGCRIELWPADPMLAPLDLVVDESMRNAAERVVEFVRLQPFALTLVDARGNPIQNDCSLLDRCGAAPGSVTDLRAGILSSGQTALRISTTATDANGKATLMAPITTRELVLEVRAGKQKHWLPVQPSKAATTLRLVVPD